MKTSTVLFGASAVMLSAGVALAWPRTPTEPLVVHEWGTFTSMQGADGVGLEGLQHEEEELPPFVYSRTEVRECPLRAYGYKGLEVPVENVTQKMETPVIYFHTDVPRRVRVRVDFVDGLLTQWYPVSDKLGPPELSEEEGPLDLETVSRSFLQWDVDLIPPDHPQPDIPFVLEDEPWQLARNVRAAAVRTAPRGVGRMGPVEAERYLFYRGLGTFSLPVSVEAHPGGEGSLHNDGAEPLPDAIALQIAGGQGRWQPLGAVAAGSERAFSLADASWQPRADAVDDLKAYVYDALVGEGLYDDEATAMVETWSRAWFGQPGSRIIYLVPRAETDRLLPLEVSPAPDALVRVLVGRLEYITPEAEQQVIADLASEEPEARDRLMRLDRFLEPHLHRAMAASDDPVVLEQAAALLDSLSQTVE